MLRLFVEEILHQSGLLPKVSMDLRICPIMSFLYKSKHAVLGGFVGFRAERLPNTYGKLQITKDHPRVIPAATKTNKYERMVLTLDADPTS